VKLLDVESPKAGGLPVLEQVRADPIVMPIAAVVLTCSREERDLVMGYDPGAKAYVIKPTEPYDFADFIREPGP
jgi:two-component system response regulator